MATMRRATTILVFLAVIGTNSQCTVSLARCQQDSSNTERELIAVLQSDAPEADKALACKHLAVYGSQTAVPELAKLLGNEHLASWARIPLEVIPGAAVDEALRDAAKSLNGKLLVGVINSLGVRGGEASVEFLASHLSNDDAEVASAAAIALGKIGNDAAAQALQPALASQSPVVRSAVAQGCILCGERLLQHGNADKSQTVYDAVRNAEVPQQIKLEATRGAILSRGSDGLALLRAEIVSPDKKRFQFALSTAREMTAQGTDDLLSSAIGLVPAERGAQLINALADRSQLAGLSRIWGYITHGEKPVRLAAIEAAGRLGDAASVKVLVQQCVDSDREIADAVTDALTELADPAVDEMIARTPQGNWRIQNIPPAPGRPTTSRSC